MAEFAVNNKIYLAIKISLFMENYDKELRMRVDIRRKGEVEKAMEFTERMKKVQEEIKAILRKVQEEMKQQTDRKRKVEEWKKRDKVMLSIKNQQKS